MRVSMLSSLSYRQLCAHVLRRKSTTSNPDSDHWKARPLLACVMAPSSTERINPFPCAHRGLSDLYVRVEAE